MPRKGRGKDARKMPEEGARPAPGTEMDGGRYGSKDPFSDQIGGQGRTDFQNMKAIESNMMEAPALIFPSRLPKRENRGYRRHQNEDSEGSCPRPHQQIPRAKSGAFSAGLSCPKIC